MKTKQLKRLRKMFFHVQFNSDPFPVALCSFAVFLKDGRHLFSVLEKDKNDVLFFITSSSSILAGNNTS